ncbi:MAG: response regulator [Hoeflea sp.]|nr:response regulator [Hoeflea sp.]
MLLAGPVGRVLVVDEDRQRSAVRVIELKKAGSDAVAIANADEVRAFLDAALSMKLTISDVEVSIGMAKILSGVSLQGKHGILKSAVERKLAEAAPPPEPAASLKQSQAPVELVPRAAPKQSPQSLAEDLNEPDRNQAANSLRSRIRVLVAEDNDVNQIVFEQILEAIGVGFRIVSNGHEAVAAWQAAVPDLILMDISMPGMNGLQATQAIRDAELAGGEDCAHVPIIAVTAHAMTGDRERCFAAGMDDYLSKPVSPEKLESIIEKWIGSPQSALAAG